MPRWLLRGRGWLYILVSLAGLAMAGIGLGAYVLKAGRTHGIGEKQILLITIGIALVLWGIILASRLGRPCSAEQMATPLPTKAVGLLAGTDLLCFVLYAFLSHGMSPAIPYEGSQAYSIDYFEGIRQKVAALGAGAQAYVTGHTVLANPEVLLVAYCTPLVVWTVTFLVLIILLARHREGLDPRLPRLLFLSAVAFAIVSVVASTVLVNDFWLSLAWGRMVAAGVNPYHNDLTLQFTRGLPVRPGEDRMTYGPMVALMAGATMWLAGGRILLGALAFKLLLTGAWIVTLRLVWSMLQQESVWRQCIGIAVFGWLPMSLLQAVADGHNDILMVSCMMVWLYCLERNKGVVGGLFLALSVLVKYVTLPLIILDVAHAKLQQKQSLRAYAPRLLAILALLAAGIGLFFRSPDFFTSTFQRTSAHFYTIRDALLALEHMFLQHEIPFLPGAARLIFPAIAVYVVVRYIRQPEQRHFRLAVLATMLALLFGYISGMWPWYLMWVLPLAALTADSALGRWTIGVALAAPSLLLIWVFFPGSGPILILDVPAIALYTLSLLWLVLAPLYWFASVQPGALEQRGAA